MIRVDRCKKLFFNGGLFVLLITAIFLVCSFVRADSETRPPIKQEKDYYRLVMTTFRNALPANGPAGWVEMRRTDFGELEYVANGPPVKFIVDYEVAWRDAKREEETEEQIQNALSEQNDRQQGTADNAEFQKLNQQFDKLNQECEKAIDAGNMKQAQKLQTEMAKVAAKIEAYQSGNEAAQTRTVAEISPHDVRARIQLTANLFHEDFFVPVKQGAPLAGGQVCRSEGEFTPEHAWQEGATYVFLGKNWKAIRSGDSISMDFAKNKRTPNLNVQTIIVAIQADPARARELAGKIKWQLLQKLITN